MSKIIHLEVFRGHVDSDKFAINGVSLIRVGPAKGHDMDIDETTLEQVVKLIPASGLKAKINHRDAAGVRSINGRFHNHRVEGGSLRADWQLLDQHPDTGWILQMAKQQPEDCGISLSCKAFTITGGDGRKKMRVERLYSGDLVDDPAANETLLENRPVDRAREGMEIAELAELVKKTAEAQQVTITDLSKKVEGFEKFSKNLGEALKDTDEAEEPSNKELSKILKVVTELQAKQESFAEAIKVIGQKPAGTVGTDTNLDAASGKKTAEETLLENKLKAAQKALDESFGLGRTELAVKYEKEFGPNWKTRLIELSAKQ